MLEFELFTFVWLNNETGDKLLVGVCVLDWPRNYTTIYLFYNIII